MQEGPNWLVKSKHEGGRDPERLFTELPIARSICREPDVQMASEPEQNGSRNKGGMRRLQQIQRSVEFFVARNEETRVLFVAFNVKDVGAIDAIKGKRQAS